MMLIVISDEVVYVCVYKDNRTLRVMCLYLFEFYFTNISMRDTGM